MKAFINTLVMLTMISVSSAALALGDLSKAQVSLDCQNLGDGVEARICKQAQSPSCADAAAEGVRLLKEVRSGKKVEIGYVHPVEEDAYYEVYFQYVGAYPQINYFSRVFVSTSPKTCFVDRILN